MRRAEGPGGGSRGAPTGLAAALLLVAVGSAVGRTATARAQTPEAEERAIVSAAFGWPPGLWLRVRLERLEIHETAGSADTSRTIVTYRMHAADHPDGRLVSISDPSVVAVAPRTGSSGADRLLALAETVLPAFIVSERGELLRLEDPAAARGRVSARFGETIDALRARAPGLADLVERLTAPEALAAKATEQWNALVWTWADQEWTLGEPRELRLRETSPLFPGREIPFEYELVATGPVACEGDESEGECVGFRLQAAPAPAVLDELLEVFLESLGPEAREAAGGYAELSIRNRVSLVTEPATLLPHELEIEQTIGGRGEGEGEGAEFRRRRIRRFEFDRVRP